MKKHTIKRSDLKIKSVLIATRHMVLRKFDFYGLVIFFALKNYLIYIHVAELNRVGEFLFHTLGESCVIYFMIWLYYFLIFQIHKKSFLKDVEIIED